MHKMSEKIFVLGKLKGLLLHGIEGCIWEGRKKMSLRTLHKLFGIGGTEKSQEQKRYRKVI